MGKKVFFLNITSLAIIILLNISCHSWRKSAKPVAIKNNRKLEDKTADELLKTISDSSFTAQWMNGKASVQTNIGGKTNSFDITLRARRDSALWVSVSPLLGIEVARVLISRDSIKFMDRFNKKYKITDYDYLNSMLKMNIDFDIIQGILTGNIFAYKKNKFNSAYVEENQYYILSTLSKHKLKRSLEKKDPNKAIIQDVWVSDVNYRIVKLSIEDERVEKALLTDYEDFRQTETGMFPFKSRTKIKADKEVNISIDYSKVNVNQPQDLQFNIPESYERIQ